MSSTHRRPIARRATHGAVSLTAGFLTGLVLFALLGAAAEDAIFSALALALLVTASRLFPNW